MNCALADMEALQLVILQEMIAALLKVIYAVERMVATNRTWLSLIGAYEDHDLGSQRLG